MAIRVIRGLSNEWESSGPNSLDSADPQEPSWGVAHAKDYGTCQLVEGVNVAGLGLWVVEDVVTSVEQVVASSEDLRRLGAVVTNALCVIDRQAGGRSACSAAGIGLHSLFTKADLASVVLPGMA